MTRHLHRWPLHVVAVGALLLVAARMMWPRLNFDTTSLVLFGVAALALVVAYLPLKRVKWGEFEAELDRAVDAFERKVVASEGAPTTASPDKPKPPTGAPQRHSRSTERVFDEYLNLVNSQASNVEKILAAGILVEKAIQSTAAELGMDAPAGSRSARALIDSFTQERLIGREEREAFLEFWRIRNKVVHEGHQPTNEQTARLLDLVWRLVRTFG